MRLKLVLAYEGTRYHGWQIQAPDTASATIQGLLEQALFRLASQKVTAFGSGRTDAGVHALDQVVHCDIPDERFCRIRDWRHALNALLPSDIRVLSAAPAPADFHARFSAVAKTYAYRFWQEQGFTSPWSRPFVWACGPLDRSRMLQALPYLEGTHDFASFANSGTDIKSTVRTIYRADLTDEALDGSEAFLPDHLPPLTLRITGSGFLKQMVRNIAGLLYDIGRKKYSPEDIPLILEKRDRKALPSRTAPACGLTMMTVFYTAPPCAGGIGDI